MDNLSPYVTYELAADMFRVRQHRFTFGCLVLPGGELDGSGAVATYQPMQQTGRTDAYQTVF